RTARESQPHPNLDVHLLPCSPPTGRLEPAPRTSLRADSAQERWEGWWDVGDESYYARSIRADGSDQWYRFADERCDAPEGRADTRVLILRRPGVRRASSARMAVIGRA